MYKKEIIYNQLSSSILLSAFYSLIKSSYTFTSTAFSSLCSFPSLLKFSSFSISSSSLLFTCLLFTDISGRSSTSLSSFSLFSFIDFFSSSLFSFSAFFSSLLFTLTFSDFSSLLITIYSSTTYSILIWENPDVILPYSSSEPDSRLGISIILFSSDSSST